MLDLIKLRQTKFKFTTQLLRCNMIFSIDQNRLHQLPWDIAANDFSTANWQILHIFSYFILIMLTMLIRK